MDNKANNNLSTTQLQSNLRKRTNGPHSSKDLENEFNPQGNRWEFYLNKFIDRQFFESLKDFDTLIGPMVCGLCDRDISKSVKIRCMTCSKPSNPLVMCLECHRRGVTKQDLSNGGGAGGLFSTHQSSHPYYVYDNLAFPLLMKDWTAKDEL